MATREIDCDVLIVGGGLGGCAAAMAAASAGRRVVMTEPTDWIGGQVTQQAVPPDENRWVETIGGTARYRRFRQGVRDYYRTWYPLNEEALRSEQFNPGGGSVSRLCHEPKVGLAVLRAMLAPFASAGRLEILLHHEPASADVDGDTVRAVTFNDALGHAVCVQAGFVLDATELGDLLPLSGCEHVTGFEGQSQLGEPHAPPEPQPDNMQSATWCFAMDLADGDHVIDKPGDYEFWRDYVPDLDPPWCGPMLRFDYCDPKTLEAHPAQLEPEGAASGVLRLWRYRQIQDPTIYEAGFLPASVCPGVTLANWPQTDYVEGSLFGAADALRHWRGAKQQALCFFYWLQTEAPRADGGTGFKGLRLRPDITGTPDGFAKHPYVRESRRIQALLTVSENHVGVDARAGCDRPEPFPDSVGVGHYSIDLHPSTGGDNYIDVRAFPFQIPLRALVPVRLRNLLPACKNMGVSHIANGCFRLHPVEWNIGEAAGLLADECLRLGCPPAAVAESYDDFQTRVAREGITLAWPESVWS